MQVTNSISQLTCLTSLILDEVPLAKLSSKISCLKNLRHLDLDCTWFPKVSSLFDPAAATKCYSRVTNPQSGQPDHNKRLQKEK